MRTVRPFAALAIATIAIGGLAACSSADDSEASAEKKQTTTTTEEAVEETTAPATEGQPDWANPLVADKGELISTIEAENGVTVEVYQVGTAKATKTGQFVDPDTNKPLIAEGDEIVFVNYVITNNGDPINLGSSAVNVEARYDDWPYMQGMDSVVDSELFEEQGLDSDLMAPDAYRDPSVYPFESGQAFSYAENFKYQKNSPITFEVTIVPVDENGDLIHDEKVEAEGTGTIK